MNNLQTAVDGDARRRLPLWASLVTCAGLGVGGALAGHTVGSFGIGSLGRWDDAAALFMAVPLIAVAVITAVSMIVRPGNVPKGCGVRQVIVLGLAGTKFALPVFWSEPYRAWPGVWSGGCASGHPECRQPSSLAGR